MTFQVFADGSANLPKSMLQGITLLPCTYMVDGEQTVYEGDIDTFDAHAYYEELKAGKKVTTSLLNTHLFMEHFAKTLEQGLDVLYVSMSSGISGTYNAAVLAAQELMEEYPDRMVHIVDSHGCGFGNGLLAIHAARLSLEGMDIREAAPVIDAEVPHICQYFTVDDLNFLKGTGRVNGATAMIGTALNIKPILYGTTEGQIVSCGKVRGRKKSMDSLVKHYGEKVVDAADQTVFISHGDCIEDAKYLEEQVRQTAEPKEIIICQHEPFSGAHVGPGMLGLFFYGRER